MGQFRTEVDPISSIYDVLEENPSDTALLKSGVKGHKRLFRKRLKAVPGGLFAAILRRIVLRYPPSRVERMIGCARPLTEVNHFARRCSEITILFKTRIIAAKDYTRGNRMGGAAYAA